MNTTSPSQSTVGSAVYSGLNGDIIIGYILLVFGAIISLSNYVPIAGAFCGAAAAFSFGYLPVWCRVTVSAQSVGSLGVHVGLFAPVLTGRFSQYSVEVFCIQELFFIWGIYRGYLTLDKEPSVSPEYTRDTL